LAERGTEMNREWHEEHRMPEKATEQQRIDWHVEHAQACGCRPVPAGLVGKLSEAEPGRSKRDTRKGRNEKGSVGDWVDGGGNGVRLGAGGRVAAG
jgi:hypothetical protein